MGSRLRLDPEHLFEVFIEFGKPANEKEQPCILQCFPEDFEDEEVLRSSPKFAFPYQSDYESSGVEHFTFVLTDIDSRFKFGFCRLSANAETCLCIISCLPWFEIFYKFLDRLSDHLNSNDDKSISLLSKLYEIESFEAGESVLLSSLETNEKYSFNCPVMNQLPSIPENPNLSEFFNNLDINNMMVIFASMLYERRIIVTSKRISRLTACVHGAPLLLYPMCWQHLYIPILPPQLLDYCSAPMPYLIGLHSSIMLKIKKNEYADAVIVKVDENIVESEHDDLASLPQDVISSLKKHLKQQLPSERNHNHVIGDAVARAFLKAMVSLIGGYRDALRFRPGEQITFDPDAFVISRPSNVQPFLKKILHMQTFHQFINDRLEMLNAGEGFRDEFEIEANMYSDRWGTQSRYKDWVNHMKKQGKKLKREGKDKWTVFAGKVKNQSKKTLKELKSKIDDIKKEEAIAVGSQPYKPPYTVQAQRPPRPPPPNFTKEIPPIPIQRQSIRRSSFDKSKHYHLMNLDDFTIGDSNHHKTERISIDDNEATLKPFRRVDTDLFNDPEIQSWIRKSYSVEDLNNLECESRVGDETDSIAASLDHYPRTSIIPDAWTDSSSQVSANSLTKSTDIENSSAANITSDGKSGRLRPPLPLPRERLSVSRNVTGSQSSISEQSYGRETSANESVDSEHQEDLLIMLDTSSSNSVNSLESMEFDPLKRSPAVVSSTSVVVPPVPKPRHTKTAMQAKRVNAIPSTGTSPVPPSIQAPVASVLRRQPSPQATDAQSIREARAAFMQSNTVKPSNTKRQGSLDFFDPLASGQLVVDPTNNPTTGKSKAEDDDDLLKEWNLDFDKVRSLSGQPPMNPPRLTTPSQTAYASMPNLAPTMRQPYPPFNHPSYNVRYGNPVQPNMIQPWIRSTSFSVANAHSLTSVPTCCSNSPNTNTYNRPPLISPNAPAKSSTLPMNSSLMAGYQQFEASSFNGNIAEKNESVSDLLFPWPDHPSPCSRPLSVDSIQKNNQVQSWEKFE